MLTPLPNEKFQRAVKYQKRHKPRRQKLTRHHNRAKSLGGKADSWNIYQLSWEHHSAYHKLFGLRSFDEAARVLLRMQELHRQFV